MAGRHWRAHLLLVLITAGITALHYFTPTTDPLWHHLYRRFYYLPILAGAYLTAPWGGIAYALLAALGYLPHIILYWERFSDRADRLAEVVMYFVIAALVGWMIAAIRRRNAALRRQERLALLGRVAAGLAHEVRNPLGGMKGAAAILEKLDGMPERSNEFTEILGSEIDRLERLVSDFVAFAKPSQPVLGAVKLSGVMRDTMKLLQASVRKSGINIHCTELPAEPEIAGDAQQLKQAFLNVLLNAVNAMSEGGAVTITFHDEGAEISILVSDAGKGISAADTERLFEPFYTTGDDGSGLGLPMAREIARAHGGELLLRNRPDGPGTIAEFRFPKRGCHET